MKTSKELKEKLKTANNICGDCGEKYGEYKGGPVGCRIAYCDICGQKDTCCSPRDWKFFSKTLRQGKPLP